MLSEEQLFALSAGLPTALKLRAKVEPTTEASPQVSSAIVLPVFSDVIELVKEKLGVLSFPEMYIIFVFVLKGMPLKRKALSAMETS